MDFVQAVWKSFLEAADEGTLRFDSPEHLEAFLAGMVENKIIREYDRDRTREEAVSRRAEDWSWRRQFASDPAGVTREPSPSQELVAQEVYEYLTTHLSVPEARVIDLRVQGLTFQQIAEQTGMHEHAARRIVLKAAKLIEGINRKSR